MARALLVAVAWAAAAAGGPGGAAGAARYVDYSGVKMPQYGAGDYEAARGAGHAAPFDDYHGHSPDASASLDYKYEEEIQGKSEKPPKDTDEAMIWRKPSRKHRELVRPPEDIHLETINKYEPEMETMPKYKSSRRFPKHRSRLKSRRSRKQEEASQVRPMQYDRERNDISDIDSKDYFNVDKDEFRVDKSKEFEEDAERFRYKDTTARLIRRKPRDRFVKSRSEVREDMEVDEARLNRRMMGGRRMDPDYSIEDDGRVGAGKERGTLHRPLVGADELSPDVPSPEKSKQKSYDEYGDYYDMKRVHNIKNKLPNLLRRTSAITMLPDATSSSFVDDLWTIRGAAPPVIPEPGATISTLPSASTLTITFTTTIRTEASSKAVNASLSLAEKSRLSILKKAQRKESLKDDASTKKPPVLLQVTNKVPVVVMVEPPASDEPWMRAREVSHDTPDRIERAKRLMRHKLVARARSIQDLTDNWDEVICDYIDVSLLDGATWMTPSAVVVVAEILLVFVVR